MIYAEVTVSDDFTPEIISEGWVRGTKQRSCINPHGKLKPPGNGTSVTLVANTHRVAVRVAQLTGSDRKLSPVVKWRLVQENFPIGALMNGETHVFDGSVFKDATGRQCFMMVALPKTIAESIGAMAEEKWGSVHRLARLDTMEHMLFRHFAVAPVRKRPNVADLKQNDNSMLSPVEETPLSLWVIFPQDTGFRVLCINHGLPQGAYSVSNHPELREAELGRAWEADTPGHVIIHTRKSEDTNWIQEQLQGRGATTENQIFCCPACFTSKTQL